MIHFSRISHRLLAVVGSVVVIGLVGLALIYANRQEKSILNENELALVKVTESVAEGLSAIMLQGHAKIGKEFADRLKKVKDILDYRILRPDGSEAFVDNRTVEAVNKKLEEEEFRGRKNDPDPVQVVPPTDPWLKEVLQSRAPIFHYETMANNERIVTILAPIENSPKCGKCHEDRESLRGVIKLTTSLNQVQHDIDSTWRLSAILISVALVIIGVGIYVIAHKIVVTHLNSISEAMDSAARGDLTVKVAVKSQDEIGRMAQSFNHMNNELLLMYQGLKNEKSKLSTLIEGAKEGIVVTNAQGEIVLVNSAAQELLEKSEQLIRHEGFFYLFDNEDWIRESIELSHTDNAPRLLSWHGRVLSVKASTIHNEENVVIGSAALMRDITEEKRLEEELKRRSVTDGLTGLYNRRHFDKTLDTEFRRWRRYKTPLSVIMIDVDHFKKFNDSHGHECGDHVLIAIAKVLRGHSTPSNSNVMAFRYGGEEMVLIAANTQQDEAAALAEKLRLMISELVIDGLHVTVSIGVAGTPAQSPTSGDALLKLADEALYDAKHDGRNQVRIAASITSTTGV
jgi:diguanylate cyclase (GGDEF)-like protein/PAS domain S-box-containing protein